MNSKDWELISIMRQEGNLSKVAKKIYLSQPAITKRFQRIEEELGVNILYKANRGVQLTPQGEYLADKAAKLIHKMENMENTLQNMSNPLSGTIKISCANFMMQYKLPQLLSNFKRLYPEVEFKVTTGWSGDMMLKLQKDEVDISFIRGDYYWNGEKDLLFEESVCLVSLNEIDLKELPYLNRIDYRTDHKLKEIIDTWWMQNYNADPTTDMVVARTDIAIKMVANGLGYAIVPKLVASRYPELKVVELKNDVDETIKRKTSMFYSSDTINLKIMGIFIDYIKNTDFEND